MGIDVSPQFNILGSTSISATQTVTCSNTAILRRQGVLYQINASGAPQGILQINGSGDYNPSLPQSANNAAGFGTGNWVTLASISVTATTAFPVQFDVGPTNNPWMQCQFVSSTGSGVISMWTASKAYGS